MKLQKNSVAGVRFLSSQCLPNEEVSSNTAFAEETVGSVQAGKRPVLVTQSNWLNEKSPTFLAAIVTSKLKKTHMDTHVVLPQIPGLPKRSMVEAEQRYAVDKAQIIRYIDKQDDSVMKEVTKALHRSEESDAVTKHRRRSHYRRKKKEAERNGK